MTGLLECLCVASEKPLIRSFVKDNRESVSGFQIDKSGESEI